MVAKLRDVMAGVRHDLQFSRHVIRGEVAYIIRDPVSFDTHAFSAADYRVMVALNGERTLGEAFEELCSQGVCEPEQEDAYFRFMIELHRAGLLALPISDERQLQGRFERRRDQRSRQRLMAPIYLRVPIWNPDAFLARTLHLAAPLFTRGAFILWIAFALLCAIVGIQRSADLAAQLPGLLETERLISMWVLLAALKVVHEFGHGYAVRAFGGAVPEMGVSLIVLTPCAYVDASASWAFPSRLRRIIVCLGGVYFESWIAGAALLAWAFSDAGAMRDIAYQTMVLASITTIGFNLNPLLRYDGYFILSDILQVPNLRQAADQHCLRVLRRIALGIDTGGRSWGPLLGPFLFVYAIAASVFRVVIVLGMCAVIATKFLIVGMLGALLYGGSVVIGAMWKANAYLLASRETAPVRTRAALVAILLVLIPALVILVPIPRSARATGIVERARREAVHAVEPGKLVAPAVAVGERVTSGEVVAMLASLDAEERLAVAAARLREAQVQLEIAESEDATSAAVARERLLASEAEWEGAKRAVDLLALRAPIDGEIVLEAVAERHGRAVAAGTPVAWIEDGPRIATLVLDQHAAARITVGEGGVIEIRSHAAPERVLRGIIDSIAPAGSDRLHSEALAVIGGGDIPVSPIDGTTDTPTFVVRVRMSDADASLLPRGARVEARLPAERESFARRWYGSIVWFNEQLRSAS